MMMFADIIKYVEEKEYQLAVDALTPLLKNEDEKIVAKAHHILGYINTRHDYTEKSDYQAKRHLRFNLNSNYPHPYGYVLYWPFFFLTLFGIFSRKHIVLSKTYSSTLYKLLVLYVFFLLSYCNSFLDINQVKFSFLYFGLIGKFLRMNSSCSSFSVLLCLASPTLFSGSGIGLCIIR